MSVDLDAVSESHTGTTGSASQASFSWTHTVGLAGVKGLLVFTFVNATANDALSVKLDPSGANIDVPAVVGARAVDTATEPGDCKAWFLAADIAEGGHTIQVNRNNNANVMYAVAVTVTALTDTEATGVVLQQENGTLDEVAVDDGSPGTNSLRFCAVNSGLPAVLSAGSNSTFVHGIDFTARNVTAVRETNAGQGSRLVGFALATSDDRAAVFLAVREAPAGGGATSPGWPGGGWF